MKAHLKAGMKPGMGHVPLSPAMGRLRQEDQPGQQSEMLLRERLGGRGRNRDGDKDRNRDKVEINFSLGLRDSPRMGYHHTGSSRLRILLCGPGCA